MVSLIALCTKGCSFEPQSGQFPLGLRWNISSCMALVWIPWQADSNLRVISTGCSGNGNWVLHSLIGHKNKKQHKNNKKSDRLFFPLNFRPPNSFSAWIKVCSLFYHEKSSGTKICKKNQFIKPRHNIFLTQKCFIFYRGKKLAQLRKLYDDKKIKYYFLHSFLK